MTMFLCAPFCSCDHRYVILALYIVSFWYTISHGPPTVDMQYLLCLGPADRRFTMSVIGWSLILPSPILIDYCNLWHAIRCPPLLLLEALILICDGPFPLVFFSLFYGFPRVTSTCLIFWSRSPFLDFHIPLESLFRASCNGECLIKLLELMWPWNMDSNFTYFLYLFMTENIFSSEWQHLIQLGEVPCWPSSKNLHNNILHYWAWS